MIFIRKNKEDEEKDVNEVKVFDETKDLLSLEEIKEKINDPIVYESMLWYFGLHHTYDNDSRRNKPCMILVDFNQKVEKYKDKKLSFRQLTEAVDNPYYNKYLCAAFWTYKGWIFKYRENPDMLIMPLIDFRREFEVYKKSPMKN